MGQFAEKPEYLRRSRCCRASLGQSGSDNGSLRAFGDCRGTGSIRGGAARSDGRKGVSARHIFHCLRALEKRKTAGRTRKGKSGTAARRDQGLWIKQYADALQWVAPLSLPRFHK